MAARVRCRIAFLAVLMCSMFPNISLAQSQSCETVLVALKKASLELEGRLKRCHVDERIKCDNRLNGTLSELAREREVSVRFRELLNAKDVEHRMTIKELKDQYTSEIDTLTEQHDELKSRVAACKADAATIDNLEDELRAEKKKAVALTNSIDDCKTFSERRFNDEVARLKDAMQKQADKIESQQETLDARNAEVDSLRKVVRRLEEQRKAGILDWLNNPKSLETLLEARNKTLELIAPGLSATERRLLELKALSSEKIERVIGIDSETSALMSGLLAWGILLIPFFLSCCLLVRVRLSLSKMVLWASLYASLFCLVMFGFSYALDEEALTSLRKLSPMSHDVLLIVLMLGHILLIVTIALLTLKQWLVTDLGSLRARHMLQFAIPIIVAGHYYYHYYFEALSLKGEEGDQVDHDFDARFWIVYAVAYFFECILVVLGNYSSNNSHAASFQRQQSPAVAKVADVVTNIVDVVEGTSSQSKPDVDDDVEAGQKPKKSKGENEPGETKKKKKRKSKQEGDGDVSSFEFLGPSDVLDAVVSATSTGSRKSNEKGD